MARRTSGFFYGTGTIVQICVGYVPDWVWVWNLELATFAQSFWSNQFAVADCIGGLQWSAADSTQAAVTSLTAGIRKYYGGTEMTTTTQPSVAYGNASVDYFWRDDKDYRYYTDSAAGISGDAATTTIDTWTLNTASANTGKFNGTITGTYIGEGSEIRIIDDNNNVEYVERITNSPTTGAATDNGVTLSYPVPSGKVYFIGGKYGYIPIPIGRIAPAGFTLGNTTVNVAADRVMFECGTYDMTP
jgi:hypothetical protein